MFVAAAVISYSSVFYFPFMLVERWNLFARGLALVFRSNPLTLINPLIKQVQISSIDKPLSIVVAEVAKVHIAKTEKHNIHLGLKVEAIKWVAHCEAWTKQKTTTKFKRPQQASRISLGD
ncbi:hypothetical protein CFP56_029129 [Quercus suber]|uniref:Uncharacterized protein n=1 Tax=Quercus suber TaxID=58331 RepID=A0AAW0ME49_QUESU